MRSSIIGWLGTWAVAGATAATVACSGGSGASAGAQGDAGGAAAETGGPAVDAGGGAEGGGVEAAPAFPAAHPVVPQVVSGGTVMMHPKVVNVSFAGDPLEADIDAFATAMGTTTYWGDRVKEYGIATPQPSARIHDAFAPPATFDDADIQTWLQGRLDGTHAEYPAADADTIYVLYFPPGVSITNTAYGLGPSCGTSLAPSWHGYHSETTLPGEARARSTRSSPAATASPRTLRRRASSTSRR